MNSSIRVGAKNLKNWTAAVLQNKGIVRAHANRVADVLVAADLRGVDSHGVFTALGGYLDYIEQGLVNRSPRCRVVRETSSTALLDGDNGFGHVAAGQAMRLAIEKARITGLGAVSVARSTHLGMLAYYPMMAVRQNMIGLAFTNTAPVVVPTLGAKPMLGTNPISVGVPAMKHSPFLLDMSTSVVAAAKLRTARIKNSILPEGWIVDRKGRPIVDPTLALEKGFLLPLGGDPLRGSHKGYGLAVAVDILCGVLSGSGYGAIMKRHQHNHFFLALNVRVFRPVKAFKAMMDEMISSLHSCPKLPGQKRIYVAGEIEHETYLRRLMDGIPVPVEALPWIEKTSAVAAISPPWEEGS